MICAGANIHRVVPVGNDSWDVTNTDDSDYLEMGTSLLNTNAHNTDIPL